MLLDPQDYGTSQGVATADENRLNVILEIDPGTPNLAGAPIVSTDIDADFQPAEDWITHRADGFKEDAYSAVVREWAAITGGLAPDYRLLVWKFACMFGRPVVTDTGTIDGTDYTEYEFRMGSDNRVDRAFVTGEWGRPGSAYRLAYGLIQALTISSSRAGATDGNITMAFKRGDKGQTMIGAGSNEVVPLTMTAMADGATLTIPATYLGAGGNAVLNAPMTAAEIRTALAAVPAIRSAGNVRVTGAIDAGGNGNVTIEFVKSLGLRNIGPLVGGAGIAVGAGTQGVSSPIVPFEPMPILPGDWRNYTAKTRAALNALGADDYLKTVESHSVEFGDLVNPHWVEDGEDTFKDHVDGPVTINSSIAMEYDDDPDSECFLFDQEAHAYKALTRWFRHDANCKDGVHRLQLGIFGSARDVQPFGDEANVYRKTFPISRKVNTNPGEGYSFFARIRVANP